MGREGVVHRIVSAMRSCLRLWVAFVVVVWWFLAGVQGFGPAVSHAVFLGYRF